jgi:tyrosinase
MISIRRFVQASLATTLVTALPSFVRGQTLAIRPSWEVFKNGPNFQSFVNAIATMRANKNANDVNSWYYWANIHQNYCTHGVPYFLVWHRGYVSLFQRQLQRVSGNNSLQLPYWDYYTNPNIPVEFTNGRYPSLVPDRARTNTNVRSALSLDPFASNLVNFPRNWPNAYEPPLESRPHNAVHNLIGGWMPTMQSPQDPIFWVHHGNIDRLWAAWVAADQGRQVPPASDSYWQGSLNYGPSGTLTRLSVITTQAMGYTYDNLALPNRIPPASAPARPPVRKLKAMPANLLGANAAAVGGGDELSLDQNSVTVEIPVAKNAQPRFKSLLASKAETPAALNSITVVLDRLTLTETGVKGGYYYNVYVDLPETPNTKLGGAAYLLGTLGAFEIAAKEHHGDSASGAGEPVQLVFPAADILKHVAPQQIDQLSVSFVRVDGDHPVNGTVINVGEVRVEASNKAAQ